MSRSYLLTISDATVRWPLDILGARNYFRVLEAIGRPQKQDIGKQCYLVTRSDGTSYVQCENNEQRDERVRRRR